VEVGWRTEGGGPVFHVRDNGIGIAAEHLNEVFQVFRRLHARDEYGGGNGAGLTIGGRRWIESEGAGKGSTFFFSLGGAETEGTDR
jgi:two-component system, chemotaxis family, sensor kinase Cph1